MDATAPTDSPEPEPAPATSGAMLVGYGAKSGSVSRRPRKGVAAQVTGSGPQADQVHDSYGKDAPVSRRVDEVRPGGGWKPHRRVIRFLRPVGSRRMAWYRVRSWPSLRSVSLRGTSA